MDMLWTLNDDDHVLKMAEAGFFSLACLLTDEMS